MKCILLPVMLFVLASPSVGQKFTLDHSKISFFSDAPLEDIEAANTKAAAILDAAAGQIAFSVPINEFQFDKSLMQEHFNEKYMESDRFPKATFQGSLTGFDKNKKGKQQVTAKGGLQIHGVTQAVEIPGVITVSPGALTVETEFMIKLEDFKIDRPQLLWQNIAEEVKVTAQFHFREKS